MWAIWGRHTGFPLFLGWRGGQLSEKMTATQITSSPISVDSLHAKVWTVHSQAITSRMWPRSPWMTPWSQHQLLVSILPGTLDPVPPQHRMCTLKVSLPGGLCPDPWKAHRCSSLWHTEKSCLSPGALTPSPSSSWRGHRSSEDRNQRPFKINILIANWW